jgi:potassium-transporting ATPase ATP-binding subunit
MAESRSRAKPFDVAIIRSAIVDAFRKCGPRQLMKNPVIFVVAVGALLSVVSTVNGIRHGGLSAFNMQISLWLVFTVLFANFAEAMAEGRGKAQSAELRRSRTKTMARRIVDGRETTVVAAELKAGDTVVCESGEVIPSDGEVIEGVASVDESAVTGESAPVIRESGGDRNAVVGGTKVLSDRIVIRITSEPGNSFLDRMIALVEGAVRRKRPMKSRFRFSYRA